MRLATSDVQAIIERLAIGYGRPMSAGDLASAVPIWRDVLEGVPWLELERAVDEAIKQPGRFMPKPGEIRARALQLAGYDQRRQHGTTPDRWDAAAWEPGHGPEGEPLLCADCGGDVTFTATRDGQYVGHIRHRTTCGRARRVERPADDVAPHYQATDEAATRAAFHQAAQAQRVVA